MKCPDIDQSDNFMKKKSDGKKTSFSKAYNRQPGLKLWSDLRLKIEG